MSEWQTVQISGETARYDLSHLNLQCLQKPLIAFNSERVNDRTQLVGRKSSKLLITKTRKIFKNKDKQRSISENTKEWNMRILFDMNIRKNLLIIKTISNFS